MFDEDVLKCAKKRMKEVNRKSMTNYLENLILEDCKNSSNGQKN